MTQLIYRGLLNKFLNYTSILFIKINEALIIKINKTWLNKINKTLFLKILDDEVLLLHLNWGPLCNMRCI